MNKSYEEIIEFCYRANYGSIDQFEKYENYWSVFSKNLNPIDFTHFTPLGKTDSLELLLTHKDKFLSKKRTPCVYTTPLLFNYENSINGMKCAQEESFLYYNRDDVPCVPVDNNYAVKIVRKDRADEWVAIFNAAFSTGVYAGLPPEYGEAEYKFFEPAPTKGFESLIFLVEKNERAVGGMRVVTSGDMAFLYSMSVLPNERTGGAAAKQLGTAVLRELFARDVKNMFLQTEYDSNLEHFYTYYGFERLFLGRYWILE